MPGTRKRLISPAPSVVEASELSTRSSTLSCSDATGTSYDAVVEHNGQLRSALSHLSNRHKEVCMEYATLMQRFEDLQRERCEADSAQREREVNAHENSNAALLLQTTSAIEELAGTVESLRAVQRQLQSELHKANEVNEALAKYAADVERTNERLSIELTAMIKFRPTASLGRAEESVAASRIDESADASVIGDFGMAATIASPRVDFHEFDPSPEETTTVERAESLLRNGAWLRKRLAASRSAVLL